MGDDDRPARRAAAQLPARRTTRFVVAGAVTVVVGVVAVGVVRWATRLPTRSSPGETYAVTLQRGGECMDRWEVHVPIDAAGKFPDYEVWVLDRDAYPPTTRSERAPLPPVIFEQGGATSGAGPSAVPPPTSSSTVAGLRRLDEHGIPRDWQQNPVNGQLHVDTARRAPSGPAMPT